MNSVVPLADGTLLLGGPFTEINGFSCNSVAHVNADGSADTSYTVDIAPGPNAPVAAIADQPDGGVVIGGAFTQLDGVPRTYLARLNSDGTTDTAFSPSLDGAVSAVVVQANGKIVFCGTFTEVDGAARQGLAHLSADGSLNPLAGSETGVNGSVGTLVLQPDGKVVIGGKFTSVDGVTHSYVARLTSGGTPDSFAGAVAVGSGFYYLRFPGGNPFGYYNLAGTGYSFPYFFHDDLGLEYFFDANDGQGGAYLYDFASSTFFYTSPSFPFPYLYDFSLHSVLRYYPDPGNPGHYNTNGIRYFYDFNTGTIITR